MTLHLLAGPTLAQEASESAIILSLPSELSAQIDSLAQTARIFDLRKIDSKHHALFRGQLNQRGVPNFERGHFIVAGGSAELASLQDVFIEAENYVDPEVYEAFWGFVAFAADRKVGFMVKHRLGVVASYSLLFNRIYLSRSAEISPAIFIHEIAHAYFSEVIAEIRRSAGNGLIPAIYELFGRRSHTGAEFLQIFDESLAWKLTEEFRLSEADSEFSWADIQARLRRMSYGQRFGRSNIDDFFEVWPEWVVTGSDLKTLAVDALQKYGEMTYEELAEMGEESIENPNLPAQWNFLKVFIFKLGLAELEMSPAFFRSIRAARALQVLGETSDVQAAARDIIHSLEQTDEYELRGPNPEEEVWSLRSDAWRWVRWRWKSDLWNGKLLSISDTLLTLLYWMHQENSTLTQQSFESYRKAFGTDLRLSAIDLQILAAIQSQDGTSIEQKTTRWLDSQRARTTDSLIEEILDLPSPLAEALICRDHLQKLEWHHLQLLFALLGLEGSNTADLAFRVIKEHLNFYGMTNYPFVLGEITEDIDIREKYPFVNELDHELAALLKHPTLSVSESAMLAEVFSRFLPAELPLFRNELLSVMTRSERSESVRNQLSVYLFGHPGDASLGGARWAFLARDAVLSSTSPLLESLIGLAEFHRIYTPSLLAKTRDESLARSLRQMAVDDLERLLRHSDPKVLRYARFAAVADPSFANTSTAIRSTLNGLGLPTSRGSARCAGAYEEAAAAKASVERP